VAFTTAVRVILTEGTVSGARDSAVNATLVVPRSRVPHRTRTHASTVLAECGNGLVTVARVMSPSAAVIKGVMFDFHATLVVSVDTGSAKCA
jgi:hypothetical protein